MTLSAEQHTPATVLSLGEVELDLAGRRLTRRGQPVRLSRTEWRLLEELAAQAGQIVTHRALLQRVWGDAYGDEANYLHVYIRRLRHKIEADPANPRFLRSEPGIGYRLAVPRSQPEPPPNAPPAPSQLPAALTSFVGRRRELDAAIALLRQPGVRLVTLAGPGGIGKTRLALAAALELRADFADGAAVVALDAVREPAQVAVAIIRALGLPESGTQAPAEQLRASLGGRSQLLVLDNFEQVLAAAPLVGDLLAAAAGLKVLATSREVLRVYGEHEFRVPPLSLAARLSGGQAEAVQLFIERARLVRPEFALTDENAAAVEAICARLEGIPLAIELAAARLRRLAPTAVLQELNRRLALGGGPHNAPQRQQTLRATIAWSYMLLTPPEQRAFRQLGVAVGGCTPAAALAICATASGEPISEADLESLADKSLLHSLEAHDGGLRYAMLETIREYALEQLAADAAGEAVRDRHLAAFLALAERAAAELEGAGQIGWLDTLAADNENLRAALDWGLRPDAPAGAVAQARRLAAALGGFWELRGHWTEGRSWIGRALAAAAADQAIHARLLLQAGILALRQGDLAQSEVCLAQAGRLWDALGDQSGRARTLATRSMLARSQGDRGLAKSLADESVATARAAGDRWALGGALNIRASLSLAAGEPDAAERAYKESMALWQSIGAASGLGYTLMLLGGLAFNRCQLDQARALLEESLRITRPLGDQRGIAHILVYLGELARLEGQWAQASGAYEEAMVLYRGLGSQGGVALAALNLGFTALAQNDSPRAGAMFRKALDCQAPDPLQGSLGLAGLAAVAQRAGRIERAALLIALAERFLAQASESIPESDQHDVDAIAAQVRAALADSGLPPPAPPECTLAEAIALGLAD